MGIEIYKPILKEKGFQLESVSGEDPIYCTKHTSTWSRKTGEKKPEVISIREFDEPLNRQHDVVIIYHPPPEDTTASFETKFFLDKYPEAKYREEIDSLLNRIPTELG